MRVRQQRKRTGLSFSSFTATTDRMATEPSPSSFRGYEANALCQRHKDVAASRAVSRNRGAKGRVTSSLLWQRRRNSNGCSDQQSGPGDMAVGEGGGISLLHFKIVLMTFFIDKAHNETSNNKKEPPQIRQSIIVCSGKRVGIQRIKQVGKNNCCKNP